jgi:hypothetical protein
MQRGEVMAIGDFIKALSGGSDSNSSSGSVGRGLVPSFDGLLKAYDAAPDMRGLMTSYFGIDPGQIPMMTPDELAELADKAAQAKFFSDNIEKIEEHIKTYIRGVVDYNEFVSRCVRTGVGGMKKIDKATLDVFLEWKGYKANTEKLAKQSDVEAQLIQQSVTDYVALQDTKLDVYLQIAAADLARQQQELNNLPNEKEGTRTLNAARAEQQRQLKELIYYGTRAALPSVGGQTITVPSTPVTDGSNGSSRNPFNWLSKFFRGE